MIRPTKHRAFAALALLGVIALGGVVTCSAWLNYLPRPDDCNREQLFRWMVLRDLTVESPPTQLALVDRFEQELRAGIDTEAAATGLSEKYREQLEENAELLKRTWFQSRVAGYQDCSAEQRMEYLDHQIETVMIWSNIDLSFDPAMSELSPDEQRHAFSMMFFEDVEQWIAEADSDLADRMTEAVRDGMACWLATRNVSIEPLATRRELSRRIVQDLNAGLKLDRLVQDLTVSQRERLIANSLSLLEGWLYDESDRFAEIPTPERTDYADTLIDEVMGWGLLELMTANTENENASDQRALVDLMSRVDQWIKDAPEDQQAKMQQLVQMLQQRILVRTLQGTLVPTSSLNGDLSQTSPFALQP